MAVTQGIETANSGTFRRVRLGSALLIRPTGDRENAAIRLVGALAPDPERQIVAAAPPREHENRDFWTTLHSTLQGSGPVRLAVSGAAVGGDRSPARWLSDRLGTEIVAPDGRLVPAGDALVFVTGGSGRWVSFQPGRAPRPLGPRFPAPAWEAGLPLLAPESAEPIPSGLWLHGRGAPLADPALLRPLFALPTSREVPTIVLGSPDASPPPLEQFAALRRAMPAAAMRVVPYTGRHPDAVGQLLADRLDERVITTIGVPTGRLGVTAARDAEARHTWEPFATEIAYLPRRGHQAPGPEVVTHRAPVAGLVATAGHPAVYELDDGLYVEVVQSGLWLRTTAHADTPHDASARTRPADPEHLRLTVGTPGEPVSHTLLAAAHAFAARLSPRSRYFLRLAIEGTPDLHHLNQHPTPYHLDQHPTPRRTPTPPTLAAPTPPNRPAPTPSTLAAPTPSDRPAPTTPTTRTRPLEPSKPSKPSKRSLPQTSPPTRPAPHPQPAQPTFATPPTPTTQPAPTTPQTPPPAPPTPLPPPTQPTPATTPAPHTRQTIATALPTPRPHPARPTPATTTTPRTPQTPATALHALVRRLAHPTPATTPQPGISHSAPTVPPAPLPQLAQPAPATTPTQGTPQATAAGRHTLVRRLARPTPATTPEPSGPRSAPTAPSASLSRPERLAGSRARSVIRAAMRRRSPDAAVGTPDAASSDAGHGTLDDVVASRPAAPGSASETDGRSTANEPCGETIEADLGGPAPSAFDVVPDAATISRLITPAHEPGPAPSPTHGPDTARSAPPTKPKPLPPEPSESVPEYSPELANEYGRNAVSAALAPTEPGTPVSARVAAPVIAAAEAEAATLPAPMPAVTGSAARSPEAAPEAAPEAPVEAPAPPAHAPKIPASAVDPVAPIVGVETTAAETNTPTPTAAPPVAAASTATPSDAAAPVTTTPVEAPQATSAAASPVAATPTAAAPAAKSAAATPVAATAAEPAPVAVTAAAVASPVSAAAGAVVGSVGVWGDLRRRSTEAERAWLRGHLGARYDRHASTAVKVIAERPALRAMAEAPGDAVLADLVALCDFLGDGGAALDEAVAAGRADAMLPYVHCVVSGLSRLASYRGVAFGGGRVDVSAGVARPGGVVTDHGIRQALTAADRMLPGPVEFVIWSATARRLDALLPDRPARRVAFPPGSHFRVLDAGDPTAAVRRMLLRQVLDATAHDGLDADDEAVRDRLAKAAPLRESAAAAEPSPRSGDAALTWHLTTL